MVRSSAATAPAEVPRTQTAAELAAVGVWISVVHEGLVAPRVDLTVPRGLGADVRVALSWRIEAMSAQARRQLALGEGIRRTLVACPGIELPRCLPIHWRGYVERYGHWVWVERSAQRTESGLCPSCGEAHAEAGNGGDCLLCIAARIAALRAVGVLPAADRLPDLPVWPSLEEWRAQLAAEFSHAASVPTTPPTPWTCARCGQRVEGLYPDPDLECGACELRRISVCDTSLLGGAL